MVARRRGAFGRRSLRAARFRRNRRGVVSVVGTLLSLLVFFALFGVFLTQYLPIWMTQNESQYSNQAQASIESLKQYVDDQVIFGGPHTYSVPFTLSSNGIPLFAQPTQGTLSFLNGCTGNILANGTPAQPLSCVFQRLSFAVVTAASNWNSCSGGTATLSNQAVNLTSATNYVEMQLPNRYYPGQTFYFANDAAIEAQSGGSQLMLVPPPLNLTNNSGNVTITSSFVILEGNSSSYSAQGSKDLYSTFLSSTTYSSFSRFAASCTVGTAVTTRSLPFDVTFTVGTRNPCAWYNFLKNSTLQSGVTLRTTVPTYPNAGAVLNLTGSGLSSASAPANHPTAAMCTGSTSTTYDESLTVYNVNYLQGYSGVAQIAFSNGGL